MKASQLTLLPLPKGFNDAPQSGGVCNDLCVIIDGLLWGGIRGSLQDQTPWMVSSNKSVCYDHLSRLYKDSCKTHTHTHIPSKLEFIYRVPETTRNENLNMFYIKERTQLHVYTTLPITLNQSCRCVQYQKWHLKTSKVLDLEKLQIFSFDNLKKL